MKVTTNFLFCDRGWPLLYQNKEFFIPTVALGAILDQSSKDPNNLFSQHILATSTATSQRVSKSLKRPLGQNIVKAIAGMTILKP